MDILKKYNEQQAESAPPVVQVRSNQGEPFFDPNSPKIVRWVIRYSGGLVKDERQADYVLIGFVALAIIVTLVLIFSGGGPKLPSQEEIYRDTPPSISR